MNVIDQLALFAETGDAPAREAIRTRLDATMFVEAGAGTGKTAALVDRVVALVGAGVPMRAIAAITFTEKAAAELRDRVRRALEAHGEAEALEELDAAAICTLHAFAQRILTEFPIEAGLPPRIVVRDEISSRVAFEARWRLFVDELLEDPDLEQTILMMLASGVRLEHLRALAEVLDDNWDLLDRIGPAPPLPAVGVDAWLAELDAVCAETTQCRFDTDSMVVRLDELAEYRDRVRTAFDDVERVRLLRADKPSFRVGGCGRKNNWPDIVALRERITRLAEQRDAIVDRLLDAAIRRVVTALARCTAGAVAERRAAGELEFHDLLVLARTLLRDPKHGARARRRLSERYQRLLIDEFQDTDPIQVEIAALLGSADADDGARLWSEMRVERGRLFFVGDPKQSIYRFRRADIATFLAAAERFAGETGPEYLSCNFRSTPRVLAWINTVFGELIQPFPGSQPEYRALDAARPEPPGAAGPGVMLLGVTPHDDDPDADTLRVREAADVAALVGRVLGERWQVFEPDTKEWRDARLGDICILLPARTSLGFLERSLDDAGIPYRAETSSLVYGSREIRELLAALRAVDDPSDSLSLVTALRSSLFGCGDDDLFTYHVEHRGRWDVRTAPPATLDDDHPVAAAMRFLRDMHQQRIWSAPSELLARLVRERRVVEVAALGGRFRDVARRVRFVIDQARAFTDAAGGTLREYLAWAELQGTEGARVVEAVLPETDDDAVRILTIHGAKGLEFPIVIASGTTTAAQAPRRGVQVLFPAAGGYEVRLHARVQTAHFELHQPVDEQMDFHEKLRLLYVACTRARDHLVVSTHRRARNLDSIERVRWTHAELLWNAARDAAWVPYDDAGLEMPPPAPRMRPPPPPSLDEWNAAHERAFQRGNRRAFVAATALAKLVDAPVATGDPGLAKDGRDLELPPWNKGRYGTAIGRAVHAVLQTVDLASGDGIVEAASAQAAAEGVLGREDTIAALARSAIASQVVRRAAGRPYWRETYVAVPLDGIALEGYVDLVYRDDDGLVVVDYKTDAVQRIDLDARLAHYRVQAAAYALAVSMATGEAVVRCVLCLLDPEGAREVVVEGDPLAQGVAEVRRLAVSERDHPSALPEATLIDA
ncbi:MAG TPA: UvrD-helicase domain-containing protein [Acidimicrobiia bacterium]|nr:UvrD-helicase domain-containing protein [Acidimicrobiia bacterium]